MCGEGSAQGFGRLAAGLDILPYFYYYRNMARIAAANQIARYADMLSALGTEPRLRIMRLLLSAHPDGLVVNEIQEELGIPNSTLSHHLDKLRTKNSWWCGARAPFCGTPPTPKAFRNFCVSLCRMLHSKQGGKTARNDSGLQIGEASVNENRHKEVVKEKYGQAALRCR